VADIQARLNALAYGAVNLADGAVDALTAGPDLVIHVTGTLRTSPAAPAR
jgi:hypothetical protein